MQPDPVPSPSPSSLEFSSFYRPGLYWTSTERTTIRNDLLSLASECLSPLPNYHCLSASPDAFNDKILVIARDSTSPNQIVAFISALLLDIPPYGMVVHVGLICIDPTRQRLGLVNSLLFNLGMCVMQEMGGDGSGNLPGFWVTLLAAVVSSLVSTVNYLTSCFPSPHGPSSPLRVHLDIARAVSARYGQDMAIDPHAVFDEENFVFRESNVPGSPFRKEGVEGNLHPDGDANEFYRRLLRGGVHGDEVLQVGFIDPRRIMEDIEGRIRSRRRSEKVARL